MKGRIKATGEEVNVDKVCDYNNGTFYYSATNIEDDRTWESHELEVEEPEEVTIVGYVARGANPHHLALYERRPDRLSDIWGFSRSLRLDPTSFPEVTWESEPLKVKITITPME